MLKISRILRAGLTAGMACIALQALDPKVVRVVLANQSDADWEIRALQGDQPSKGDMALMAEESDPGQELPKLAVAPGTNMATATTENGKDPAPFFTLERHKTYYLFCASDKDQKFVQYVKIRLKAGPGVNEWVTHKLQMVVPTSSSGKPQVFIKRVKYSNPDFIKINNPTKDTTKDYDTVVQVNKPEPGSLIIDKAAYSQELAKVR